MLIRKLFIAFVFVLFLGGGTAIPVSIDTTDGVSLSENTAEAKSHKAKKSKGDKKAKKAKKNKKKGKTIIMLLIRDDS